MIAIEQIYRGQDSDQALEQQKDEVEPTNLELFEESMPHQLLVLILLQELLLRIYTLHVFYEAWLLSLVYPFVVLCQFVEDATQQHLLLGFSFFLLLRLLR